MQYFARSVEIALGESAQQDDYGFRVTPATWSLAIKESNFVAAQEELRMVMSDNLAAQA